MKQVTDVKELRPDRTVYIYQADKMHPIVIRRKLKSETPQQFEDYRNFWRGRVRRGEVYIKEK